MSIVSIICPDPGENRHKRYEATDHALARSKEGARPDENTSQRLCQPHGGRQLSWWCHGRSIGWLKCGAEWTRVIPRRASTLESVHENKHNTHNHTRFTQVRGPRVEVTPLLLPISLLFRGIRGYKVLLELYITHTDLCLGRRSSLCCLGLTGGNEKDLGASSLTQEGVRAFI